MATISLPGAGVTLVGEPQGSGERGTIVLLHGGGQTRHSWDVTAARLARDGWAAITLDARGHGDSEWDPRGDYTLSAFVDDLVAALASIEDRPVLVGASLGGTTGLIVAAEHPTMVRALVLVDVVIKLEPAGVRRTLSFLREHRDGFASLEDVAVAVEAYNPIRRRRRNLDGLGKNVRQCADARWYWHWDPAFIRPDRQPLQDRDFDRLRRVASTVAVPTLLVRGGLSDVTSDDGFADMQRLIPEADRIDVDDAGHMVVGDDNDMFWSGLEDFLGRLPAAR